MGVGRFSLDECVEAAVRHILAQEGEIILVENLEELLPTHALEPSVFASVRIMVMGNITGKYGDYAEELSANVDGVPLNRFPVRWN